MERNLKDRVNASLNLIEMVEIQNIEEIIQLLTDQPFDSSVNRHRSPFFYRGIQSADFFLQTTLQRNCKEKAYYLESIVLRNFGKYAIDNDPQIMESGWRQMVLGQHHGLPTRLMDWSYSPLVALHFAVNDSNPNNIGNMDCVVWKISCEDVISTLPKEYYDVLVKHKAFIFNVNMLDECAKDIIEYDKAMEASDSLILLEPPSIDQRIINQYSYFTVMPHHIDCFEEYIAKRLPHTVRYVIRKELRWQIRDMLDQMNINERTLTPGFDGLANWLKRYYFVL